jgi:UDP-N-acetyl-alpha-D-muramoyl-L-alanyl-L-glutamate epimerase
MISSMQPSIKAPPQVFVFRGYEANEATGEVRFYYGYDNGLEFCETVHFGLPIPSPRDRHRHSLDAALKTLHVALGVSYFKAFLPREFIFDGFDLTPRERVFFQDLYVNGLGEFGFRNNIDVSERVNFLTPGASRVSAAELSASESFAPPVSFAPTSNHRASNRGLKRRAAVLLGGGKDSIVSTEILRAADEPITLFAVNPKKPMIDCASASGVSLLSVHRQLDVRLFELNDAGALNGHVPITALVSLIAAAAAFIHDFDTIVLSSERSANEGNVELNGRQINHQYSKTTKLEVNLKQYISANICEELNYFSLLRPLSELHIAHLLARTERYDECFTSCNRSFRIRQDERQARWCRNCPKCRFTFLILATAMSSDRLDRIFGGNILTDSDQLQGYEELVGLAGHKPWECVGEIAESCAAMLHLASQPFWCDTVIVKELAPRIRTMMPDPTPIWNELLTPSTDHYLPPHFAKVFHAYVGAS